MGTGGIDGLFFGRRLTIGSVSLPGARSFNGA
jgi:hypothetical protein